MIRHVVLFAWIPEATDKQKHQVAEELRALPPLLTGLRSFHAGPDAGIIEGNFDFAVVADFDDVGSYLAYRDNPEHQDIIRRLSRPHATGRGAVQFEL